MATHGYIACLNTVDFIYHYTPLHIPLRPRSIPRNSFFVGELSMNPSYRVIFHIVIFVS